MHPPLQTKLALSRGAAAGTTCDHSFPGPSGLSWYSQECVLRVQPRRQPQTALRSVTGAVRRTNQQMSNVSMFSRMPFQRSLLVGARSGNELDGRKRVRARARILLPRRHGDPASSNHKTPPHREAKRASQMVEKPYEIFPMVKACVE